MSEPTASSAPLSFAIPSKGRLMDDTLARLSAAGLEIERLGAQRGYQGVIRGRADVAVQFLSAGEIADALATGRVDLGVTGLDLVRETLNGADDRIVELLALGFGRADVVIAVPDYWLDVERVADLEAVAVRYRAHHHRRPRVATKYRNLTRAFLKSHGVTSWLVAESLGATEGMPASGAADIIVDITSTGATLNANHLKTLSDGLILSSEAWLVAHHGAATSPVVSEICVALSGVSG